MRKREADIHILFSNNDFESTTHSQSNKANSQDNRDTNLKKNVHVASEKHKFPYEFNDYLKLTLTKIIPCSKVILLPEEQAIVGTFKSCKTLQEQAEKEFREKSFKVIRFKTSVDIDQIEFSLDPIYQAQIYRQKVIRIALGELHKIRIFEEQCYLMHEKLSRQNIVLLRVAKQYEQQCLDKVNKIIGNCDLEDTSGLTATVFEPSIEQNNNQNSVWVPQTEVSKCSTRKKFNMSKYLNEGSSLNSSIIPQSEVSFLESNVDSDVSLDKTF